MHMMRRMTVQFEKINNVSQIEVSPLQSPGLSDREPDTDWLWGCQRMDVYHDPNCCASGHYEYATGTLVPGLETL